MDKKRVFIQPMALFLLSLLVAALFFVNAMMDLHRLEKLLLDTLKNKALYVLEVARKSTQDKYELLVSMGNASQNFMTDLFQHEAVSLQEALAASLIDQARAIDAKNILQAAHDQSSENPFLGRRFQGITILNGRGALLHRVGDGESFPFRDRVQDLVLGKRDIVLHIFQDMDRDDYAGFVGVRNTSTGEIVLLELARESLSHWIWKTALESALQEIRWGLGVVYLVVEDGRGQVLARSGSLSQGEVEECLLMAGASRDTANPPGQCIRVGDTRYLQLSMPFAFEGGEPGVAKIGLDTQETDRILEENRRHIFGWTALMAGIGLLAMGLFYGIQKRHMSRIQSIQARLHQAEKLSSLGKLGAGVAHEIRNPLNAISLAVQRLQREFRPDKLEEKERYERCTFVLSDEIRRLNSIVEDFLSLSRNSRLNLKLQSPVGLLERILALVEDEASSRGVTLRPHFIKAHGLVWMDAYKMEQALLNILRNAMESMGGGGMITVSCDESERDAIRVKIQDTGAGIPPGEENLIFDPFYTTKADGVGLGLAIAHEIVAAHGGEIRVASRLKEGATFEICLPRAEKEA